MAARDVTIINRLGMHARPAARVVQTTLPFASDIYFQHNGQRVNAKSIMGLLTLAAAQNSQVTVICKGPDARAAMDAVRALFAAGLGDEASG